MVVAVISVDSYPFLAFPYLTCHLEDEKTVVFWLPRNSKETELGSSNQVASPLAGENTGVVLVPCCVWRCVPVTMFPRSLGFICYGKRAPNESPKNHLKDWRLMNSQSTFLFLTYF